MRRTAKGKGTASRAGPTFVVPGLDRRDRHKVQQIIDAQLAEIKGTRPREPHLHRFRFQLVPLAWLAGAMAGLAAHAAHAFLATAVAAALAVVMAVALTRHRRAGIRRQVQGAAVWAACWALAFTLAGAGWWGGVWELGWAVPSGFWLERYRWKGPAAPPASPSSAEATWNELAAEQKWAAWLGPPQQIAAGGTRYPVVCKGSKTAIGKITSQPEAVAAAYEGSLATVLIEPDQAGLRHRGTLTLLRSSTLDEIRPWDGIGIDPATGLAVVGRFPEGGNAHERYYVPGVGGGTKSTITSGADGSGKTGFLDMGMCISVASGIIAPVILDPQMGQALPAWRDVVPYACGIDECMSYLRGLYAAMMARSEHLGQLRWQHPRTGRKRRGIGFWDYEIIAAAQRETGGEPLPVIEITLDEAPILLAVKGAVALLTDIAKLGRKVGFRLRVAAQVPSLAELKAAELRSILVGGNVFAHRAGDKVSGGMMNVAGKPNEIPKTLADGTPSVGMCFASTVESRSSVIMRDDHIEEDRLYDFAETAQIRAFDSLVADHVSRALNADAARVSDLARSADSLAAGQLQVLATLTGPMPLGAVIAGCGGLRVSEVMAAVEALEDDGRIRRSDGVLEPA